MKLWSILNHGCALLLAVAFYTPLVMFVLFLLRGDPLFGANRWLVLVLAFLPAALSYSVYALVQQRRAAKETRERNLRRWTGSDLDHIDL